MWFPLVATIVFLIGCLLYFIPTPPSNGKLAELGRIFIFVGLLFIVWALSAAHIVALR